MTISVRLELSFDTPDEILSLLNGLQMELASVDGALVEPEAAFASRVQRSESLAKPLMDIITAELAKKGLKPIRFETSGQAETEPISLKPASK